MEDKQEYKTIYSLNKQKFEETMADPKISSGAKLVLRNLIDRLYGKYYCFPSQERIAKDLGLSERQIRYHTEKLKKHGILSWKRGAINPKTGSLVNSNEYNLSGIVIPKRISLKKKKDKDE